MGTLLHRSRLRAALVPLAALFIEVPTVPAQSARLPSHVSIEDTGCTAEERRSALRDMQAQVLDAVPEEVDSLKEATAADGPLAGWRLSHGLVVLSSAGAVAIDNIKTRDPVPQLLLYAPSSSTSAADWLDFDGDDGPYRLAGWGYIAPYQPGSAPPARRCIAPGEWLVHEAGWHMRDGGMVLTPGAETEPPRGDREGQIHMWHPQVWDLHVWRGENGVAIVSFANPNAAGGGKDLPREAFFYLVDGRRHYPVVPPRTQ